MTSGRGLQGMSIDLAKGLRERLPQMAAVAGRFPLAVIAATALALYFLFDFHHVRSNGTSSEWRLVRIPAGLAAAFLWAVASALWAEARHSEALKHALGIAGWCAIALLVALSNAIDLNLPLLCLGLLTLLAVAAHAGRGRDKNAALWLFNQELWSGASASIVATVLSAGGISAIIWTLDYLFGVKFPYWLHEKVWIVASMLIGPLYWLSLVPRDLDAEIPDGEPREFVGRALSVLGKFVVVPLLLIYCAILHAYAAKILHASSLPKGLLGWMVLSFGGAMSAALLAIYPTRDTAGAHVRFFWQAWPYLLCVPLALLFLAVGVRVRQYGLTEQRYLVALAGVWLGLLALIFGLRGPQRRDLRTPPALLGGLLVLASFGPWGMMGWSIRNQVNEFVARLTAAGLMQDGHMVPDARPTTTLLPSDRQRLYGIVDYLNARGRLGDLRPIFAKHPRSPFNGSVKGEEGRFDNALADRIRDRLGISAAGPSRPHTASYAGVGPSIVAIGNGARLVGPLNFNVAAGTRAGSQTIETPAGKIVLVLDQGSLRVTDVSGKVARFELGRLLGPDGALTLLPRIGQPQPPIEIDAAEGPVKGRLVVISATGRTRDGEQSELTHMNFWLVLDPGI